MNWSEAVENSVRRYVDRTGLPVFTRQALIDGELDAIIADTGSAGATPHHMFGTGRSTVRLC